MNRLDQPINRFRSQLYQVADMVTELYSDIDEDEVYGNPDPKKVHTTFSEELPCKPHSIENLLTTIKKDVFANSTIHYSPHFYPWVTSCASQASILGDFLATALNVNSTTWMNSAASSEIEARVIQWIGEFSGYDNNASGVLLSGGSTANLTGLTLARRIKSKSNISEDGLASQPHFAVYTSEEAHFCIDKSIDTLGIGKKFLRKIPTLKDYTIDISILEDRIKNDIEIGHKPICIVGIAGSVNSGAIDPLDKLSKLCKKYDLWFHIDAAYGGCAANVPIVQSLFKGIEKADSIAIDLHKWLFVPFEAGCILVKDRQHLKNTFSHIPEYQKFEYETNERVDFSEYSFQQSRNFKALKIWMNFKAYGKEKLTEAIEGNILVMRHLSKLVQKSMDFELVADGLSIVCFRYIGGTNKYNEEQLNELNKNIVRLIEGDRRVFIRETVLNGKVVLRGCCTNFRREKKHVDYLLKVVREISQGIKNLRSK